MPNLSLIPPPFRSGREPHLAHILTRALVGSFYNAIWWGGLFLAPPRISGTTGPIYKTQAAFDSPGQFIERK